MLQANESKNAREKEQQGASDTTDSSLPRREWSKQWQGQGTAQPSTLPERTGKKTASVIHSNFKV